MKRLLLLCVFCVFAVACSGGPTPQETSTTPTTCHVASTQRIHNSTVFLQKCTESDFVAISNQHVVPTNVSCTETLATHETQFDIPAIEGTGNTQLCTLSANWKSAMITWTDDTQNHTVTFSNS